MNLVTIDFNPHSKILRQFGFIAFAAFGLLGGLALWRLSLFGLPLGAWAKPLAIGLFAVGTLSALFSLVAPRANRALYVVLVTLTFPIGFVLSFLILGILFYGVLSPVGLLFRLIGRDGLELRLDPDAESYWVNRDGERRELESYFKQF